MSTRLGVGIVGCGQVTQTVHLPALAALSDLYDVVGVWDVDAATAEAVAARSGARVLETFEALLTSPEIDIIVIASPDRFHADQVIAACVAGKRGVLCEKPLATSPAEAEAISTVAERTGVPILVGAMHAFDPGWTAMRNEMAEIPGFAHTVRVSAMLPPNSRFTDITTEALPTSPATPAPAGDVDAETLLRWGILGLAVHDIPLVRTFVPDWRDARVVFARALAPFGYEIVLVAGERRVELHASATENWHPDWTLTAIGDDAAVEISFAPSFVSSGSAVGTHMTPGSSVSFGPYPENGYLAEWLHLHRVVEAGARIAVDQPLDDARFTALVAEQATDWLRAEEGLS